MADNFGAVDYLVLVCMLIISTLIGLYFAWKDRNNTDEDEFLRGGKKMSILPVSVSIMASFLPSTSFLGFPTVIYATGTQFAAFVLPGFIAAVLACEVFLPVFYNMNLVSVNQYLHKRFSSKWLQIVANISTLIAYIPYLGVEMLAPAIALSIVTDMSITASIFIIALIVTLYTSLGGLKGVIWTDFFQFCIMIFGLIAVIVRGANVSGGMAEVFKKAYIGGRLEFWNMDFDIYSINSFWVILLGFSVIFIGTLSVSQLQVQRAVCMPSLRSAKVALYAAMPVYILIMLTVCLEGVVMYARYYDCDPMLTGRVSRPDQLLPYFVLDIFEDDFKGLPGAFVACIFGSSLSTLSSGLNGMASIVWDDYAKKFFTRLPERYNVFATRGLAALIGLFSLGMAFAIKESDSIVEAVVSIYGSSLGPLLGTFCLGLFTPWSNAYGAGTGLVVGQFICYWMTIGWVSDKRDPQTLALALSTEACAAQNITVLMQGAPLSIMSNYKIPEYHPHGIDKLHHISPFFVPFIGFLLSVGLGNIISLMTKGNKNRRVDVNLVSYNVCYCLERLLPESWRQLQDQTPRQQITKFADRSDDTDNLADVKPIEINGRLSFVVDAYEEDIPESVRLRPSSVADVNL